MKIKKDDKVVVVSGKDKGKQGKILVADLGIPFEQCEECRVVTYTDEDKNKSGEWR